MEELTTSALNQQIEELEKELIQKKKQLADLRKQTPKQVVNDYVFKNKDGEDVTLSSLFGDKKELMIIHNMGKSCSYCTLWADELNGIYKHIESRISLALISPDSHTEMKSFTESRDWKLSCFSCAETTFKRDLGFQNDNYIIPGVSVLLKDATGKILHYSNAQFGPFDEYCSLWSYFELLPGNSYFWAPQFEYE
jgi:predicted dithiol-disulfide oxidoreductase (DUF899 family)